MTPAEISAGGRNLVFGSLTSEHRVYFNGTKISPIEAARYDVSSLLHPGTNTIAVVVTDAGARRAGIGGGAELDPAKSPELSPIHWQIAGDSAGSAGKWFDPAFDDSNWQSVNISEPLARADDPSTVAVNLYWYRLHFDLPAPDPHIWVPWKLHLKATGDGFIYLNGHALGRQWEVGPQQDFYLPECWLNFGPGSPPTSSPSAYAPPKPPHKSTLLQSPPTTILPKPDRENIKREGARRPEKKSKLLPHFLRVCLRDLRVFAVEFLSKSQPYAIEFKISHPCRSFSSVVA